MVGNPETDHQRACGTTHCAICAQDFFWEYVLWDRTFGLLFGHPAAESSSSAAVSVMYLGHLALISPLPQTES